LKRGYDDIPHNVRTRGSGCRSRPLFQKNDELFGSLKNLILPTFRANYYIFVTRQEIGGKCRKKEIGSGWDLTRSTLME
jgi:hypothetical protein